MQHSIHSQSINRTGVIYETKNLINGKLYRGQHICNRNCRGLVGDCKYLGGGIAIKRSIKKYGQENFSRKTLLVCAPEHLNLYEKLFIDENWCERTDTYNLMTGGGSSGLPSKETRAKQSAAHIGNKRSLGFKHTAETKRKQSKAHMGKKRGPHSAETKKKISMANTGKKHSSETIAKQIERQTGKKKRPHSAETKRKISAGNTGKKRSPELRARLSVALMGNKNSLGCKPTAEARAKQSAAQMGKKHSPETREKISISNRGQKRSPEARANMRAAWARKRAEK